VLWFDLARRPSPTLRTSFYYFVNFTSSGATVAYGGIWLASKGISSEQIGVINALPVFIMLGLNLVVGRLADRANDWRQVIIAGALVGSVVPFLLFFADGFWAILAIWTCSTLPIAAIGPVVDAAALRMAKRHGAEFGTIRAWGTVGYMVFNAVTGVLAAWLGSVVFVPLFAILSLLRGIVSLALPKFRAPTHQTSVATIGQPAEARKIREVLKPWFLLPLVGFAIIFATHLILNAFAALLWKEQGISESLIGPLIALGALAEATTMFLWQRVGARFSPRAIIMFGALASVVRWTAMAMSPPVYVLVILQLMQSLTYAMGFLASVHFIAKWTSEDIAAEVQSFFVVLQQVASVIALIGFGWLISVLGAHAYFVAAGFALLGAGLVWVSLRLKQPTGG
jgi:PPP family 3-phenylpropionic acid transporter